MQKIISLTAKCNKHIDYYRIKKREVNIINRIKKCVLGLLDNTQLKYREKFLNVIKSLIRKDSIFIIYMINEFSVFTIETP